LAAGSLSRLLHSRPHRARLGGRESTPGPLPLVSIDHVWYDGRLRLVSLRAVRTPLALVASDHVPIVAEFEVGAEEGAATDQPTPDRG
jgi:endonuclease/exonuclease/phosphatase family metal-dependent hydrolase